MAEKRILIIEDEEDVREFLKVTLLSAGYSVDAAATAAEANRHLDAVFYTLVIADWRLPDGDGTELADRAFGLRAKTLILSGYLLSLPPEVADRHEPIMKPIRSFELVAAVQRKIGNPGLLHLN
jgi:DNA-binding NtrC family response regulator